MYPHDFGDPLTFLLVSPSTFDLSNTLVYDQIPISLSCTLYLVLISKRLSYLYVYVYLLS